MNSPAPSFSNRAQYRDLNRRMADDILAADPDPYVEGGYVRRVVEIRGRRTGQVHQVPIAVISVGAVRYVVSPTRERNWVRNLLDEPDCVIRSGTAVKPAAPYRWRTPGALQTS